MKLLHIIATPRNHVSNTLTISKALLDEIQKQHSDLVIDTVDLFLQDLPAASGDIIEAKYELLSRAQIDDLKRQSWSEVESHIYQFLSADLYLITSPMWNFSIPYVLKFYIDTIVQPQYLFRFTETGVEGLAKNKKMICVTTRGSDYSPSSPMHVFDFQEPYLRAIFGFVGITDITFINAQPMDITPEIRAAKLEEALSAAREVAVKV
jgi:FMN-dependent NADH-azoreductase